MKTTERFDNAVSKLYTAFHENRLNAMDCSACAVGNMCDGDRSWAGYAGFNNLNVPDSLRIKTGYSSLELGIIETLFMYGAKNALLDEKQFRNLGTDKDLQFKGLCAVVEYLCELDNIPNVMDYTKLFESENNEPKYQLNN